MKKGSYSLVLLLMLAALVSYLSYVSPWVGDDIEYAFFSAIKDTNGTNLPIHTLQDIFVSQYNHYQSTNGRTVAHCFVQYFCGIGGQISFSIFNGLMYVLLVILICSLMHWDWKKPRSVFVALLLVLFTFNTGFTPSCQIGYIWMFCTALGALYIFQRQPKLSFFSALLVFLFSILAGWGQESLNFGLCMSFFVFFLLHFKQNKVARRLVLIGFGLGTLMICLSPGAWTRAAQSHQLLNISLLNLAHYSRALYLYLFYAFYLLLFRRVKIGQFFHTNAFYLIAIFTLLCFNLIIGISGPRQLLGIELLSILGLLQSQQSFETKKAYNTAFIILLTFFTTLIILKRMSFTLQTRIAFDQTMAACRKAPSGSTVIHYFGSDAKAWPGDHFLRTMEKKIKIETGHTIHIIPAGRLGYTPQGAIQAGNHKQRP